MTNRGSNNTPVVDDPNLNKADKEKLDDVKDAPMQAELKHIDRKHTEQGKIYYAATVEEVTPEQINWWSKYALCLVRYLDSSNKRVQKTSMQINSQHLKDMLKEVIGSFPGISFATKEVSIDAPYRVLYHYYEELEQAADKFDNASEARHHANLLLSFIKEEFKDTIAESKNLVEQGLINFQHLWTIFRPGVIVYAPVFGQPRAFKLLHYDYICKPPGLNLRLEYVDFDGQDLGTRTTSRMISAFGGAERIDDLSAFPIDSHPNRNLVKQQLIARGEKWEAHTGMHFCYYNGIALEIDDGCISRYSVDGRIVVDTRTSHRLETDNSFSVSTFKAEDDKKKARRRRIDTEDSEDEGAGETFDLMPSAEMDLDPLTDDQRLLATAVLHGFSFTEKRWLDFFVGNVEPIAWNPDCFQQLVLPEAQKDLVQALVATHAQQKKTGGFDDIVKGKGRGLIFVLHGPPGVGKTLTAETVAECIKRPLYMVSSGDLGTSSESLDARLSRILDMASTWKAVLLIDEADVFLEARSLHDMERNSLVSIFLRVLEYYEGILFMTSNRVSTFDDAFKSRIHVPLKYNDLTVASRRRVWDNFLTKIVGEVELAEEEREKLATTELNGRQIKNVIRTAKSLAQFHGSKLDLAKLEQVIRIQVEFEREMGFEKDGAQSKINEVNGVNGING